MKLSDPIPPKSKIVKKPRQTSHSVRIEKCKESENCTTEVFYINNRPYVTNHETKTAEPHVCS